MANTANPATYGGDRSQNPPPNAVPSLLGVIPRIFMITFGITGISFAVSLFVGILCMAFMGLSRGHLPDMRLAYRMFAIPVAVMVGTLAFCIATIVEFRGYFEAKRLNKKHLEPSR